MGEVQGATQGITLNFRDWLDSRPTFYGVPIPSGSTQAQAADAVSRYTQVQGTPTGTPADFWKNRRFKEDGLPVNVYPRAGLNIGTFGYGGVLGSAYFDEAGNTYPFIMAQAGMGWIAHQVPYSPVWYAGLAGAFSPSGSEGELSQYETNGGHSVRGYVQAGGMVNILPGLFPNQLFPKFVAPHAEPLSGVYLDVNGAYGAGGARGYSDSTYLAETAMVGANICLVGLDEIVGLCFGRSMVWDQHRWSDPATNTSGGGWTSHGLYTVSLKLFQTFNSRDFDPLPSRADRPINADILTDKVEHANADTYYTGEVSNGLTFVVTQHDIKHDEWIKKVHPSDDTDGMPDGLFHGDATTEDAQMVKEVTIIFTDRVQDIDFEKVAQGSPGWGNTSSTSMLNREITMHAGPGRYEWFEYDDFIYRVILYPEGPNKQPRLAVQSYLKGTPESDMIFSGNGKGVQIK